jgi:hypothetical protein
MVVAVAEPEGEVRSLGVIPNGPDSLRRWLGAVLALPGMAAIVLPCSGDVSPWQAMLGRQRRVRRARGALSRSHAARRRGRVVDDEAAWALSDHCPIAPEFRDA